MTPFAGINRITSPYGYREYWYNGRLIKEQHKAQAAYTAMMTDTMLEG